MSDTPKTIDDLIRRICRDFLYYHANEVDAVLKEDIESYYRERARKVIKRARRATEQQTDFWHAVATEYIANLEKELGLDK